MNKQLSQNINFEVGMKVKMYKKSSYGEQYDEVVNAEVLKIRNYKKRGKKLDMINLDLNIGFGIWKDEYTQMIEVV